MLDEDSILYTPGASTTIPQITNPVNFTDCCMTEGVSSECSSLCYPSTVPADAETGHCAADLPALLKCGAGK